MNPHTGRRRSSKAAVAWPAAHAPRKPSLAGLRQSEREAYQFILEFLEQGEMSEVDKLKFLQAVETLSGAVHAQADVTMDDYFPKTILAKKIEHLILEEAREQLTSNVRQQAMLCIVALSQVDPPFSLSQKLDLVTVGVSHVFALPLIMPSADRKDSASLYFQTAQALEDMLQALVMDGLNPNMVILQEVLEIILPWLTMSEKVQEQTRALSTVAHMLRFICNFPHLLHMADFSISGKLMGTLGLFCTNPQQDIRMGASEGLHYLFQILVLHRRGRVTQKTEVVLKNLQKHFLGEWFAHVQDLAMCFRKYLSPEERADVIMVSLEAVANASRSNGCAAAKILETILTHSMPDIGKVAALRDLAFKVADIVQYIYHNLSSIAEPAAQATVKKVLHLLAQTHTDDVILTLFKLQDRSPRGVHKPWEILASCPSGYQMIMERLIQRLEPPREPRGPEPSHRGEISALIATRAIHELLLESSRRTEVQTLFSSLVMALLFQTSHLVLEGDANGVQDGQHASEGVDPVSSSVEALKTLLRSAGYGDHVSFVQKLGGWELLTSPDRHYDGVMLLARAMVIKSCWHNRPVFSFAARVLQELGRRNHLTVLAFMTELLRSPEVAATVDDATMRILASWFRSEDPTTVALLLQAAETLVQHGNLARQFRLLQPCVLSCCYSQDRDVVTQTLLALRGLVQHLGWQQAASFLVQLTFTLQHFFEEESEHLRLAAFEIYRTVLAKVTRRVLVFPLRHQVLSLVILLVLHLQDRNRAVAQVCRQALCRTAAVLGWRRLRAAFAEKDVWGILGALLRREAGRAPWFLRQGVALFRSPQAPIRRAAVWLTGQIMQTLDVDEVSGIEEARTALWSMRDDPDPTVSCLATQTCYVVEAKERRPARRPPSCFCCRRPREGRW